MNQPFKKLLFDFFFLFWGMLSVIFFWKNSFLVGALLLTISILMLFRKSRTDQLFFLMTGLGATLVESLTISTGAWVYSSQQFLGTPFWIPLYWGMGATVMKDIYFLLEKVFEEKD